ncbi:MAG: dipeptide ABC transporter ATP-binding protein [Candidatus Bathyarchaeota archaeon]|nr:dipeptide ABC transporter ATP-binding protein [Candidatus Bathyarchaeota archaeon]
MPEIILKIENLKKYFPLRGGIFSKQIASVRAVDDVSFDVKEGETFGLVGESGCGKTTLGRCVLLLTQPTDGKIFFEGRDLIKMKKKELRTLRQRTSMIFQDPYSSLNPRMTVGDIIGKPLEIHKLAKGEEKTRKVIELMKMVGLSEEHIYRYPHEFSGGQKQRIGIARALAVNPKLIVADEAVAALDVSVRAGILNLMKELQKELGLTYIFISHDLSVVKHICDKVAVMYLGEIVEIAESEEIFNHPLHPYTKALISAIPIPDPTVKKKRIILEGDPGTPIDPPPGCRFHERCSFANERCKTEKPPLQEMKTGHWVACHELRHSSIIDQ